jgi:hypothetical protein
LRYLSTAGRLGDMLDMTRERLSGLAEQMQAAAARTTTAATPSEG